MLVVAHAQVASQVEHFREIIRQRDSEICNLLATERERGRGRGRGDTRGEVPAPAQGRAQGEDQGDDQGDAGRWQRGFYVQL